MAQVFYICDVNDKTRLPKWHRTLGAVTNECKRLNKKNDKKNGRTMARYFCGDWAEINIAMEIISKTRNWPIKFVAKKKANK
jgi:hypothetical protein